MHDISIYKKKELCDVLQLIENVISSDELLIFMMNDDKTKTAETLQPIKISCRGQSLFHVSLEVIPDKNLKIRKSENQKIHNAQISDVEH